MARKDPTGRDVRAIAAILLAVALMLAVTACSKPAANKAPTPTGSTTAKQGLTVAQSALSTMAPDGKLLLVQTAQPVTATSTPVWAYLFGSPKTNKTYVVYVRQGQAMGATEYGDAGLGKSEWASVPGTDAWKVDSDAAYEKAASSGTVKNPTQYGMGFLTYVPKSAEASPPTQPMTWYVTLWSGTTTGTVKVDAKSGDVVK